MSPDTPSPSMSLSGSFGNASHTSPIVSPSVSSWSAFAINGQLSIISTIPSLSESGPPYTTLSINSVYWETRVSPANSPQLLSNIGLCPTVVQSDVLEGGPAENSKLTP